MDCNRLESRIHHLESQTDKLRDMEHRIQQLERKLNQLSRLVPTVCSDMIDILLRVDYTHIPPDQVEPLIRDIKQLIEPTFYQLDDASH